MDNSVITKPTRLGANTRQEYRAGLIAVFAAVTCLAIVRVLSSFGVFTPMLALGETNAELLISLIWPTLGGAVVPFVLYFSLASNKKRFHPKTVLSGLNGLGFGKMSIGIFLLSIVLGILYAIGNSGIAIVSQNILIMLGFRLGGGSMSDWGGLDYLLVVCLTSAVMPALFEEFTCRGLLLKSLGKHGEKFAILISALVFGLFHMNLAQTYYTFVMGLVTAFITIKLRTVWPAVIIHFINNFGGTVLPYLSAKNLPGKQFYELMINLSINAPLVLVFVWGAALGLSVLTIYGMLRYNKYHLELRQHKQMIVARRQKVAQGNASINGGDIDVANTDTSGTSADVSAADDSTDKDMDLATANLNAPTDLQALYAQMRSDTDLSSQDYTPRYIDKLWLYATLIIAGGATIFSIIWSVI